MAGQHALLSPSSAHIWLNCPPAARLAAQYDDPGSQYAQQGSDAHELCEFKLLAALGQPCDDPREHLAFYDSEMERCSEDYATFVVDTIAGIRENCPDPTVLVEQQLDLSRYIKDGFGRGDCVIKPIITPHYFRHNYITLLYEAGVDPLIAMKIAGHSDYQTTASVYTHIRDEMLKKSTVNMDDVFRKREE